MVWTVQEKQARDTVWTIGVARMQIWVLRSNLYSFGNISMIGGIIQIDQCKVKCLLHVPWSLISTFIFSNGLLEYIRQKSYFNFVKDIAI